MLAVRVNVLEIVYWNQQGRIMATKHIHIFRCAMASVLSVILLSPPVFARDWYEYQSHNFIVYSDTHKGSVERVISELERFRSAALLFTGLSNSPENSRLKIYHFHKSSDLELFTHRRNVAGFYREAWTGPEIFSQHNSRGIDASTLMFHEYTHHLMRYRSTMFNSKWYSEGFAEMLETAELRRKDVLIGKSPSSALSLGILHLRELFTPNYEADDARYWHRYYGTAWLFTHYLQLGGIKNNHDYKAKTGIFLQQVAEGGDPDGLMQEHFGKTIDEMHQEVRAYSSRGLYGYGFPVPSYQGEITRRKLSDNARVLLFANNAFSTGKEDLAKEFLQKGDPDGKGWDAIQARVAILKAHEKDFSGGEEVVSKLIASGNLGAEVAVDVAHFYADKVDAARGATEPYWDEESYARSQEFSRKAISLDPRYIPAYYRLWTTYMYKGEKVEALKVMMEAYKYAPNHLELNSTIGFHLAELNRPDLARSFLQRVIAWSHDSDTRARAQEILEGADG
ncbi:tetratricopeptide repeat protein [Microbulbifer agarilyticus]